MLSPRFAEGQAINTENPKVIELPEDEGQSMKSLCGILHFSYGINDAEHFDMRLLWDIVVAAHKYDCLTAVAYTISKWVRTQLLQSLLVPDLLRGVLIAYLLKCQDLFCESSRRLIYTKRPCSEYLPLAKWLSHTDLVPVTLLGKNNLPMALYPIELQCIQSSFSGVLS